MAFFKKKVDQPQFYATVGEGLKKIYKNKQKLKAAIQIGNKLSPKSLCTDLLSRCATATIEHAV